MDAVPALTQIAVFSAAGLFGAYLSAVCLLPALLNNLELRPAQWPLQLAERLVTLRERLLERVRTPVLLALLIAFCAGGLMQLQSKNDIRQWVGAPQQLTDEAQTIARITGYQPTSQFFLVRAANQEQLLERQAALSERLQQLVNLDKLQGYLALDQLVSPPTQQERVRAALINCRSTGNRCSTSACRSRRCKPSCSSCRPCLPKTSTPHWPARSASRTARCGSARPTMASRRSPACKA